LENIKTLAFSEDGDNGVDTIPAVLEVAQVLAVYSDEEKPMDSPEDQWKSTTEALSRSAKLITQFFLAGEVSDGIEVAHSFTSSYLRKCKRWTNIRSDQGKQEAFTLGYIHALNQLLELFIDDVLSKEDEFLLGAIDTYKYIKPCIFALVTKFQLSHSDLAQQIGISKESLSNFMSRVDRYKIFDSTVVGRYRYYSLAQPNGKRAAVLIKKLQTPNIEKDTQSLESILRYLLKISQNKADVDEALETCRNIVQRKTTTPNIILKQVCELATVLKSSRYPLAYVLRREREVRNMVAIYITDTSKEKIVAKDVAYNIKKKQIHYFYLVPTGVRKKAEADLIICLKPYMDLSNKKELMLFEEKVKVIDIKPESFGIKLNDVSEVVVHDLEYVFISKDRTIGEDTFYTEPEIEKREAILKAVEKTVNKSLSNPSVKFNHQHTRKHT